VLAADAGDAGALCREHLDVQPEPNALAALRRRRSPGGAGPEQVRAQIEAFRLSLPEWGGRRERSESRVGMSKPPATVDGLPEHPHPSGPAGRPPSPSGEGEGS